MAIHRAPRPEDHFTQIHNDVLRDDRLSYRARGILAAILSRPDDWATSAEALARSGPEGRDAIRTALQELEDAGYLVRERKQDTRGRWSTAQVIYDRPQSDGQPALFDPPTTDFQASVNQPSVSQASIEDQHEHLPPTEVAGKEKPPAQVIAEAVYEHAQKMVNFMAVRQVAARALKVKVGNASPTPDQIVRTMCALYDQGRPLTLSVVGQALSRSSVRETNGDHWAQGGEF